MILQALCDHYDLLASTPGVGIPRYGYSRAEVSFALVVAEDGSLSNIVDLRTDANRPRKVEMEVPYQEKQSRTSGIFPFFLCDNTKYLFGVETHSGPNRLKYLAKRADDDIILDDDGEAIAVVTERSRRCREASARLHREILGESESSESERILQFIEGWTPERTLEHPKIAAYKEILIGGASVVFDLDGRYAHDIPGLRATWEHHYDRPADDECYATCLVSGLSAPIARTHQKIAGVAGPRRSGATLVGFNDPAFCSYGKEQSFNAPVSKLCVFKYSTVLNYLLADGRHTLQIGDATVVYWAETTRPEAEDLVAILLDPPTEDATWPDPALRDLVSDVLECVKAGRALSTNEIPDDPSSSFYLLGLSPNNARLAVRFWYRDEFGSFVSNLARHHLDLEIDRSDRDPRFVSFYRLLAETVPKPKPGERRKDPAPGLGGRLMQAVLNDGMYPVELYQSILNRIKVDHSDRSINRVNAGFIKAFLLRWSRSGGPIAEEEITVSLNQESQNVPYRLGRLFAVLEKVQGDAIGDVGSGIKSKYFSSASSTPAVVFPVLLKLGQHHIAKSDWGAWTTRNIEEILSEVDGFPPYLGLEEQGMFMLGYYHQHRAFYQKREKQESGEEMA